MRIWQESCGTDASSILDPCVDSGNEDGHDEDFQKPVCPWKDLVVIRPPKVNNTTSSTPRAQSSSTVGSRGNKKAKAVKTKVDPLVHGDCEEAQKTREKLTAAEFPTSKLNELYMFTPFRGKDNVKTTKCSHSAACDIPGMHWHFKDGKTVNKVKYAAKVRAKHHLAIAFGCQVKCRDAEERS